jgi:hypothetical protein
MSEGAVTKLKNLKSFPSGADPINKNRKVSPTKNLSLPVIIILSLGDLLASTLKSMTSASKRYLRVTYVNEIKKTKLYA